MKVQAVALDYDGTIAQNDTLDIDVRRAIAELRAQDIAVLLVTGRRIDDLQRVAGDLHFVDAVIAENGAVISFPESEYERNLGQAPPPVLLKDLQSNSVEYSIGRCVVDADANAAPMILSSIQKNRLPLSLIFNRSRVMILPQAITKATGLLEVLAILRLSPHNTIGIGDAENDHELLRVCELGVAVAWGSEELKSVADFCAAWCRAVQRQRISDGDWPQSRHSDSCCHETYSFARIQRRWTAAYACRQRKKCSCGW